jgi:hypothetical protein
MGNQLPVAVGRVKLVTPPVDEPLVRGDDGFSARPRAMRCPTTKQHACCRARSKDRT